MRAVGAGSSWVVVGNGGAVRVRPARTVDGRPGNGPPGTPGDPSRRASSQGAAQQRILPLLERAVHVGGPHARGTTHPGRGSRPAGPGRAVGDGPPMMPVRRRSWGHHAVRVGLHDGRSGPISWWWAAWDRWTPRSGRRPGGTAAPCAARTAWPGVLPGPPGRGTHGRRRGRPPGGGRPLRVVRGGALPRERRVAGSPDGDVPGDRDRRGGGHVTRDVPGVEAAGYGVT